MVLEGKTYAKRPKCGNCTECKGHPVPISRVVHDYTRLARPEKGGLRGKLTEEDLEKVLATYVKG